jgi:periplasmic divalent cation tolerance protein
MNSKPSPSHTFGYCTFPDEATAERICEMLVAEGVVACANIHGPIKSIYKWQGRIQREAEYVAILKTRSFKKGALMERIRATHPYANPCLVFLDLDGGLPGFLNWISTESL